MAIELRDEGASAEAVRHHYDVSNDFYKIWLDPSMTYSCALWSDGSDGDSLEDAQRRKIDFHIEGARAPGAARVLDVGCGWGGVLHRMVNHHGVKHAVGLTLSQAQADWVSAWKDPRCEVRIERWSEHVPEEPYDAIISVGAFEHFARFGLRSKERVQSYRLYFQRCHEMLKPGGYSTLQTMAKGNTPLDRERAHEMAWLYEEMFPETEIPRFCEVVEATEKLFEIITIRNDREHYARTCSTWRERLLANREAAVSVVGEAMVAKYDRYLELSARGFSNGTSSLLRIVMKRV